MSFISISFLLFFPAVVLLYYILPHSFRWIWLLAASCIFYMAFIPKYIFILLFTIVVDYTAAIFIERAEGVARKYWLTASIVANLGVLAVFKYYHSFLDNFRLHGILPVLSVALPIGLSFHTFQAMAYTIEVYRKKQKAERHIGIYALFIMFFPQLVAGPIERPQHMLHQFRERRTFDFDNASSGLRLILWGFFKKMVIADRLAMVTDQVYSAPAQYSSVALLVGTLFFAFQVYTDFSAYSDIAIGSARIMGFTLMRNFDFPYQSKSFTEFWRRWHISLSSWFRDYLYIPLGGNKVNLPRWIFNIMIVFVLSGLWHGANWTFIAWGALNGIYILLQRVTSRFRQSFIKGMKWETSPFYDAFKIVVTFTLITIAWTFFRANTIGEAVLVIKKYYTLVPDFYHSIAHHTSLVGIPGVEKSMLILSLALITGLYITEVIIRKRPFNGSYLPSGRILRWGIYYLIILLIVLLGIFEKRDFIYFQF